MNRGRVAARLLPVTSVGRAGVGSTRRTQVTLHVYAVGHAKAIQEINYVVENFLHEGGVFHGAIEVFGQEFSFGGCRKNKCGIFACKPKQCPMHTYRRPGCTSKWAAAPPRLRRTWIFL